MAQSCGVTPRAVKRDAKLDSPAASRSDASPPSLLTPSDCDGDEDAVDDEAMDAAVEVEVAAATAVSAAAVSAAAVDAADAEDSADADDAYDADECSSGGNTKSVRVVVLGSAVWLRGLNARPGLAKGAILLRSRGTGSGVLPLRSSLAALSSSGKVTGM